MISPLRERRTRGQRLHWLAGALGGPIAVLCRLWFIGGIGFIGGTADITVARAQSVDAQVRYINELKQRNANYGPGCNGIGISVPDAVNMPDEISSRWAGGHSACVPGMRLVMTCAGEVAGEDRIIGCTVQVADGEAAATMACERFTLITPDARFTPDPVLSDILAEGSEGGSRSCSGAIEFAPGATVATAFLAPAAGSEGDLALMIDVDGSEVPAFLVPAGQLGLEPLADS